MDKNIKATIKDLFDRVGIEDSFEVSESPETINVVLDTKDSGIVIGKHGDTLESLQLILSLLLSKASGNFKRVSLEVGDYKKNREEYLVSLAQQIKERAMSEKREIALPNLKPWERRVVHLYFQEDEEVSTDSIGEGRDRTLVIKPK